MDINPPDDPSPNIIDNAAIDAAKKAPVGAVATGVTSDSGTACFYIGSGDDADTDTAMDSAAIYWAYLYYEPTLQCNVTPNDKTEAISYFYKWTDPTTGITYLTYTKPKIGDNFSGFAPTPNNPPRSDEEVIGLIHTHPDDIHAENGPSTYDFHALNSSQKGYVCTPDGYLKRYTSDSSAKPVTINTPGTNNPVILQTYKGPGAVDAFNAYWASHGGLPSVSAFADAANQAFSTGTTFDRANYSPGVNWNKTRNAYNVITKQL